MVQAAPWAERSESPFFSYKTLQMLGAWFFYGLTSLIFNQTSSIWQVVRVCKCECPGKFCSPSREPELQWIAPMVIKQEDDLKGSDPDLQKAFYVCPFAQSYFINELYTDRN